MSLSLSESVRVALCPERVAMVRMSRGKQRMLEGNLVRSSTAESGVPPWAAALDALKESLDTINSPGSDVTVVLSNHFVRYLLVPWNDSLTGADEELAHARLSFSRVYGDVAESWDVRLSPGHGGPQVACAVDNELLASLDQAVAASGRRLNSVQPYLMTAFNHWRKEFVGPLVWFALVERCRLCLATLQNGQWHQIVNQQCDADWASGLPALLARQRLLAGLDGTPGKLCVFAPDKEAEQALQHAGETVHWLLPASLPNMPADEAACFNMALNG